MHLRYSSMERPGLDQERLRAALVAPQGPLSRLDVVAETGSTNSDLADEARLVPSDVPDRVLGGFRNPGRSAPADSKRILEKRPPGSFRSILRQNVAPQISGKIFKVGFRIRSAEFSISPAPRSALIENSAERLMDNRLH